MFCKVEGLEIIRFVLRIVEIFLWFDFISIILLVEIRINELIFLNFLLFLGL